MNYPGRGAPRSPERNGRGGGAWELGSDAAAGVFGGGGCCFEPQPGDGVPLSLLRAEPLHLAPGADDLSHLALDSCLSDEPYDFSSAESGSSLRYYSEGESAGGGSSSSPPPPLVAPNSGGGGAAGGGPGDRKRARPGGCRYEVVTELGPEEVRWFYKEDKKTWKPFIGYDSLRIELAFRTLLQTTGAQARAAGRDGERVCGPTSSFGEEDDEDRACGFCPRAAGPEPEMEELVTIEPVCVRGGLYEVDVTQGECYPVYWNRKWLAGGGPGSACAGPGLGFGCPGMPDLGLGCRLRGMPRQVKGKRADGSAQAASGGPGGEDSAEDCTSWVSRELLPSIPWRVSRSGCPNPVALVP